MPEYAFEGTLILVARHSIFYGHDAKEDKDYHPELEIRSWGLHAALTL